MFSRKISRVKKETQDGHPEVYNLPKRSSLMCLPENSMAMRQSRTPPPRLKHNNTKRTLSMESLWNPLRKNKQNVHFTDQVIQWAESLNDLLSDPEGVEMFLSFLRKEHSAENIQFWIECQKYKNTAAEKLSDAARNIHKEYLMENARFQINIDSSRLKEIEQNLDKVNAWTFANVEQDIFHLMKRDSYPRFLKSQMYLNLLHRPNSLHGSITGFS